MTSNNELKQINVKGCSCYYLDNLIDIDGFVLKNIKVDKNYYNVFLLTKLDVKRHTT